MENILFKTPIANVSYDPKKGYVHVVAHAIKHESVEDLNLHLETCDEEFKTLIPFLLLIDFRQIKGVSKDIRDLAAKHPLSMKHNKRLAVLVGFGISKIIGNLALRFSKPKYPTRLFTNEEKAIEWLLSFE